MTPDSTHAASPRVSIAIFAWNEENAIRGSLNSLLRQSLFTRLAARGETCEIVCVVNGSTDQTAAIAERVLQEQSASHPAARAFTARVANIPERGKLNAWNRYVHGLSSGSAEYLILMDADIEIHEPDSLWLMVQCLEAEREAVVSVDAPIKDIALRNRRSLAERLSLGAAATTRAAAGQLCAQLYCIRAEVARNIYLPRELFACEDGFIKALVCTDFLEHSPDPRRIRLAQGASHVFEAYTSPLAILKNQKRQIMGQTLVHILIDQYLKTLSFSERQQLARTLQRKESEDPDWLKRLLREHLRQRHFWNLHPGQLGLRFRRLQALPLGQRLTCLPSAVAGFLLLVIASAMAFQALAGGATSYWPKAERSGGGFMATRTPLNLPRPQSTVTHI